MPPHACQNLSEVFLWGVILFPHVRSLTLRAWGFAQLPRLRRAFTIEGVAELVKSGNYAKGMSLHTEGF